MGAAGVPAGRTASDRILRRDRITIMSDTNELFQVTEATAPAHSAIAPRPGSAALPRQAGLAAFCRCALLGALSTALAAQGAGIQIRCYPSGNVRAYEAEPRRGWSSVLLQNVALLNDSDETVTVDRAELDLVADGEAIQTQRVTGKELEGAAKKGAGLQQAGLLELLKFQFRPDVLLADGFKLAGTRQLPPRTALLLPYRYYTFAGRPEAIRVRTMAHTKSGKELKGEGSIPVLFFKSEVKYAFPTTGPAFVGVGQGSHQGHRWVVPEEFALDIARVGCEGRTYHGDAH